ncbi:MAG: Protein GrpE [Mycoplasmataceae bacterium]|nr:MAG: Protein GrpE [Mycoplasmataceae bacterium]
MNKKEKDIIEKEKDLNKQLISLKEDKIRVLADLENERKNHIKEIENVAKFSNKKLILKILPLIENYERALKLSDGVGNEKIDKFISGFSMVLNDFKLSLKSEGVEEYSPIVKKDLWDSNFCEVVEEIENNDYEEGTVLEVIQKGYFLNKRLLVTAKVSVSKKTQ